MHENVTASIALLCFLLFLLALGNPQWVPGSRDSSSPEGIYVQAAGEVAHPGVYEFKKNPTIREVLLRAGGLPRGSGEETFPEKTCERGQCVAFVCGEGPLRVLLGEMSAYHKITLGIPISVNREGVEGLMALPGIGERLAQEIVSERARRGGFRDVSELMSVKGIGPKLYRRISRNLML